MASLIDSVKTVVGDSNPFFKLAGLSFLIFVVSQMVSYDTTTSAFKTILMSVTSLLLFGFVLQALHNTINEENVILPNLFNPLSFIVLGVKGLISLFPYIALVYFGVSWINSILTFVPWVNYMILTMVFVVLFSFFVIGMLLFSKKFNMLSSLNIVSILKYSGDFIAYSFTLALSLIFLIATVFFPIGFFVKLTFGYGLMFDYYVTFAVVFLVMAVVQYYSQLYFEYIDLSRT